MQLTERRHLSNRLRLWRVDHGLSLGELSDLTGCSKSMLSRVERGQREMSPLMKANLARRLSVPIRDLFDVEALAEDDAA